MIKLIKKLIFIIVLFCCLFGVKKAIQAKYILTRELNEPVSVSKDFYFDAEAVGDKIVYPRTADKDDHEDILTTETQVSLTIKNNDGTNYNIFPTNYTVEVIDGTKFAVENTKYTGTIDGGVLKNDTITFKLKIINLEDPSKTVKLKITSTEPQEVSKEIELKVQQDGAIQSMEDLIDFSLAMRNHPNELYGWTSDEIKAERWKMTRDLDFSSDASYEEPHRTDFGDVNLNGIANDLKAELTSETGFLPIGIHIDQNGNVHNYWFMGTFNGGGHSISNLHMEKSLQMNIGLFGWTNSADIRNFNIKGGKITNHNQTAAMVIGKMDGGIVQDVTVDGTSVLSLDEDEPDRDTYAAGIAGYVEKGATIKNCVNKATVTTKFTGDTSAHSGAAGGIAAWMATSNIYDCTNYGEITGQKYVGGICGFAAMQDETNSNGGGTVSGCHNYGSVKTYITANSANGPGCIIGGICGYLKAAGQILDCTNHAEASVSGINEVGGIVGYNYGVVKNCNNECTNLSAVRSNPYLGGICGRNSGTATGNTNAFSK